MIRPSLLLAFLLSFGAVAQTVAPPVPAPTLKAGEGLAIALGEDEVRTYGAARTEAPMGDLAKLVWMKLEGADWSARGVRFRCGGAPACREPKGHGRVDLAGALQRDCDAAFLAWIGESSTQNTELYGPEGARLRVDEAFGPFLGRRLPPGDRLPALTAAWVGRGDLLRTSPEAFLRWLMEPDRTEVVTFGRRYLAGFWVEVKDLLGKEGWWFKTATAPIPGDPSRTSAWVAGGRGPILVVLHVPEGRGEREGMARIREILGLDR
ncbi:hypothetical protein [Geothrix sp. 21YS21S-4]|uniref:hypothetical protein n=1 Tax=Geothrix sp. 21YS21S-4 TaxID=3068889 RepID=UPI0027B8918C|nr:hypothetical protein [Geothrix sp. 21YS21S-4]